ncbi:hypothetical protein PENSPDRAFT_750276 [Peniophora sp. CONT]|nr:hypothetical protein PENSPDRAFT_750276 [Peniophora sp. CONT]
MPDVGEKALAGLTTKKRKLSIGEVEETDEGASKRTKNETVDDGSVQTVVSLDIEDESESSSNKDDPSTVDVIGETETFYLYGDAMITVFEYDDMEYIIRRKSAINQAWRELERKKANSHGTDSWEDGYAEHMAHWEIHVADEDESRKGPRAQKLVKQWGRRFELKEQPWWYEILMQRKEPPGEDDAAIEVVLSHVHGPDAEGRLGDGTWWITAFKAADETQPALKYFTDNIPYIHL